MKKSAINLVAPVAIATTLLAGGLSASAQAATKITPEEAPANPSVGSGAGADEEKAKAAELAQKLSNPVSALISVPIQNNFDFGAGPAGDGFQYKANIQPVIPISLDENWNLISRTILPVVYQENIIGTSSQAGLSDMSQSLFFSPAEATSGGWIWGAGPVLLFPTATDEFLGSEKWGAGPTAVVLKQQGSWTYGALANHIWSYAGESSRTDVNATFLQPFLSYTTKKATTYGLQTEATYDWENSQWSIPMIAQASQVLKAGKQPISLGLGAKYYVEGPTGGPDWGLRFTVTFLFPK